MLVLTESMINDDKISNSRKPLILDKLKSLKIVCYLNLKGIVLRVSSFPPLNCDLSISLLSLPPLLSYTLIGKRRDLSNICS